MQHDLKFGSYAGDTAPFVYWENFEHIRETYG